MCMYMFYSKFLAFFLALVQISHSGDNSPTFIVISPELCSLHNWHGSVTRSDVLSTGSGWEWPGEHGSVL